MYKCICTNHHFSKVSSVSFISFPDCFPTFKSHITFGIFLQNRKYQYSLIFFYQLEANYFTILQWFLSYIDMNQPWIYMYSPSRSPPPTSLSTRSLWVFPVHQVQALLSCIQPGLVICFTLDNIHEGGMFQENSIKTCIV